MSLKNVIKILIVDDSLVTREFLVHIFSEAGIKVLGAVSGGEDAVKFLQKQRPDVITMDIYMPGINGIEATRQIMETNPVPIIIVSGNWDPGEVDTTFRAMEAGALAVVRRPYGIGHPEHKKSVQDLVDTVKLMSEVKVVRRWSRYAPKFSDKPCPEPKTAPNQEIRIVAIGASAGGPPVIQRILGGLDRNFHIPVLIVQHMAPGFLSGMLNWLGEKSSLPVKIAKNGEVVQPGTAYFAPDGFQMGISCDNTFLLSSAEHEHGARPSISYLFRSVSKAYGGNACAVLLTGMGSDGAEEMKLLKEKGAITIAQDKESSAVYGLPEVAVHLDAATLVLSPDQIAATLNGLAKRSPWRIV